MPYARLHWKHGQPYSEEYDDVFFSRDSGVDESLHVFVNGNALPSRFSQQRNFCIVETGFGTGLNFLLAARLFLQQAAPEATLDFFSVEKSLLHPDDIARCWQHTQLQCLCDGLLCQYPLPVPVSHRLILYDGRVRLTLLLGDIEDELENFPARVDAWMLDGFAPSRNASMWSSAVFRAMARSSHHGTTLATYTVAGKVRRGLQQAGFSLTKAPGFGHKREMLTGCYTASPEQSAVSPWYHLPAQPADTGNRHAVILGTGIAGLATAWQLRQRGWSITMIDRSNQPGSGASGNAGAIVMPQLAADDRIGNDLFLQAFYFATRQYRVLRQMGMDNVWFESGVLKRFSQRQADALLQPSHIASHCLQVEAGLMPGGDGPWLECADAGWVRPERLCRFLFERLLEQSRFICAEVNQLMRCGEAYELLDADGHCIARAAAVVLANAHGVARFDGFDYLPVEPNRGQVTLIPQSRLNGGLDRPFSADRYCIPAADGGLLIGASYQACEDTTVSLQDNTDNVAAVNAVMPGMISADTDLAARVSLRAVTPDRLPVVGAAPDVDFYRSAYAALQHGPRAARFPSARYQKGLYLNIGHGSRGFTTAFLSAEIVASMMDATPLPVSAAVVNRLAPARFVVRQLKAGDKSGRL